LAQLIQMVVRIPAILKPKNKFSSYISAWEEDLKNSSMEMFRASYSFPSVW
jgi:hypothetical protein